MATNDRIRIAKSDLELLLGVTEQRQAEKKAKLAKSAAKKEARVKTELAAIAGVLAKAQDQVEEVGDSVADLSRRLDVVETMAAGVDRGPVRAAPADTAKGKELAAIDARLANENDPDVQLALRTQRAKLVG